MRLLFRTVKLDHALRLLPRDLHNVRRSRARFGFVDYLDVYYDLSEERLARVFAASGPVDGRGAGEFVYRSLNAGRDREGLPGPSQGHFRGDAGQMGAGCMRAHWEHRFWAPGQPFAVYVNGRFQADWSDQASAEAHVLRLERAWANEKEALRASWKAVLAGIRSASDLRSQ